MISLDLLTKEKLVKNPGALHTFVKVRSAEARDAHYLVELIGYSDYHGVLSYITGNNPEAFNRLVSSFSYRRRTIFSYVNMIVAEQGNTIYGVLYGYDRDVINLTVWNTFKGLIKALGFFKFFAVLPVLLVLFWKAHIKKRDYYVSNIAVRENARRTGIGCHLMKRVEAMARMTGKERIALDVAEDNEAGRLFFARLGFARERQWSFRGQRFLRMEKKLV